MPADLLDDRAAPVSAPPLAGYTVGVTADRRAAEQIELLRRKGAEIVHGPTIATHPLGDEGGLVDATRALLEDPPEVIVLLTALGIRSWMEAAESLGMAGDLLAVLERSEVWVRGPKAMGAAVALGLDVVGAVPARSADLGEALLARGVAGCRVAVQLDGAGNVPLLGRLADAGADVVGVPVYRWSLPADVEPALRLVRAVVEGRVDAVTFTTRTAIANLLELADGCGFRQAVVDAFASGVLAVCVGPVCADRARTAGLPHVLEPERFRLGSMVLDFARTMGRDRVELDIDGRAVAMQGRLVQVAGADDVLLTDRERDVLRVLAAQGGRVVSKAALLRAVWGPAERDTHLVEVTVGRLRQRIGTDPDLVETVHRRGYRLAR